MPKSTAPKVFKVKKSTINENPDNLVVRFKNLDKKQVKEFKRDLDEFCQAYFCENVTRDSNNCVQ